MRKIEKIVIEHIRDENPDLSYLGEFSDTKGKFAVYHSDSPRQLTYFNAENVENMKQAKQNYEEMMKYENGDRYSMCIRAYAEVWTSKDGEVWQTGHKVVTGGLWGIESDADDSYKYEVEQEQFEELKSNLKEFGFTDKQVSGARIDYNK